ncbi:glutaredoxin domain-containing protein [Streptomyces sp. NPDC059852]|uniref:glutaredoxin domain-containing protein n=1 Tax=Streptomyces sp. NPDC059852 TaxID=3346972 RepID=UPI00364BA3A5
MTRRWTLAARFALGGAVLTAALLLSGDRTGALTAAAVSLLIAVVHSPLVFPRSVGAEEARRLSDADGRPVVYWRPGCVYCLRLRLRLGLRAGRAHWVDIWRDPAGAAEVRAANGGDETVPTVVVAGRPHTDPDPRWVRERLAPAGRD